MRGERAGRSGQIGASAQEEPTTRREQKREDKQEFGRGGSAERYKMHEKMFGIGDDFWIENESGQRVFKVDGKLMRVRDTLVFEDKQGKELVHLKSQLISPIHDTMDIERIGGKSAKLKADLIDLTGADFTMKYEGGKELRVKGNILNHEYAFYDKSGKGQDKVAEVSMKWFRIADTYGVQIEEGQDDIMILAATVALDQLEKDAGAIDL